jgi:hypothetical protein
MIFRLRIDKFIEIIRIKHNIEIRNTYTIIIRLISKNIFLKFDIRTLWTEYFIFLPMRLTKTISCLLLL